MPDRDPAKEPERVQFIWFGEELSDNAKAGLQALSRRIPNSKRELVAMPRHTPGETGRLRANELMEGYRAEAQQHGVDVRHIREDTGKPASVLEPKYRKATVDDIFRMEMSNQGYIAAKDLATYLLRGSECASVGCVQPAPRRGRLDSDGVWILPCMIRNPKLGEFSQTCRLRPHPEDDGLRVWGAGRRVPGLRRDEPTLSAPATARPTVDGGSSA
ncbi:hypothetical protein [Streptomyces sp. NPDC001530]|uniref:hypothetical protein n=1 Tax=Streptomyces sp. NPDC001530 TaxID=3364582 RepID=UPI00369CD388